MPAKYPPLLDFNNARGAATLLSAPPFSFRNVIMRNFPLRANPATLTDFCDRYLNIMPPEIAYFRPSAPFVVLSLINYGRMASEILNAGWVAQNEVVFNIPLEWYRKVGDELVFQDWASCSPFIYVDSAMSEATGREVFGWPKVEARLTGSIPEWSRDVRSATTLMTVEASALRRGREDGSPQLSKLLEVVQAPAASFTMFPPDLSNPFGPLTSLPKAALTALSVLGDLLEAASSSPLRGYPPRTPSEVMAMASKALGTLTSMPLTLAANTINLKQFRDGANPGRACFQALTNGVMKVQRINRGGLLGDPYLLAGDSSAGFEIRLHRKTAESLLAGLGIKIDGRSYDDEGDVVSINPLFPSWTDVNFLYGKARSICWRAAGYDDEDGTAPAWFFRNEAQELDRLPAKANDSGLYNTARGEPFLGVKGPVLSPKASIRVLPLVADTDALALFCRQYLNAWNPGSSFKSWGEFVYMIAVDFDGLVTKESGEISSWAGRQVSFVVPVRRTRGVGKGYDHGVLYPYVFVDSDFQLMRGRETLGVPMMRATLASPANIWADEFLPEVTRTPLLAVSTSVIPALGVGAQSQEELLMEIFRGDPPPGAAGNPTWGQSLTAYALRTEILEALRGADISLETPETAEQLKAFKERDQALLMGARQVVNGRSSIREYSVKQFRDAESPRKADYMALVEGQLRFASKPKVQYFPDKGTDIYIALHQYPTQPIAESLGLRSAYTDLSGDRVVDYFRPINPFWISADLENTTTKETPWFNGETFRTLVSPTLAEDDEGEFEPQMILDYLLAEIIPQKKTASEPAGATEAAKAPKSTAKKPAMKVARKTAKKKAPATKTATRKAVPKAAPKAPAKKTTKRGAKKTATRQKFTAKRKTV